jgi:hypothetical protein
MKTKLKILIVLVLFMALALPAANGYAQSAQQITAGSKLVLGGVYALGSGETLDGDLFVLGGNATLEAGSIVTGSVAMLGGNLQANGQIDGDLIALGGLVQMSESTVIEGDVNALGGDLQGESLATITGQVNSSNANSASLPLAIPGGIHIPVPNFDLHINPAWDFLWLLFQSFLWAALAVLVVLFAEKPTRRVGQTVAGQPVISGGLGLLTAIVAPLVLVVVAITIIGIPLALLGILAIIVTWAFGIIAIGAEVGERLARLGKSDWAFPVSAALGVFLVTLVINTVGKIIPCVGWLLPFLVGLVGLGAVLLTRFGSRPYPTEIVAVPPAPPAEPDQTPSEQ